MGTHDTTVTNQIARTAPGALAVRSSALVARGLRDLARDSNWLIKKVFTGRSQHLAISPEGQVCAISTHIHHGTAQVALFDIELSIPTMALSVPGGEGSGAPESAAVFSWSPSARYLAGSWGGWPAGLHLFDLHGKLYLGRLGELGRTPGNLVWSASGDYFASTSRGRQAALRVWDPRGGPPGGEPTATLGTPDWLEPQQAGDEFADEGAFGGYGRAAFSPNQEALASVIEIKGEWGDDSIMVADVTKLSRRTVFGAQGHVTDLTWSPDSEQIIYCAAGQAYRIEPQSVNSEALPFGAELCVCHPHLALCVCFSSWLKNSAKGRLFLVDLSRWTVFDEYPAEGVADLRWSADGARAYAVTRDGMAYIYEPPLI
jgi:WD40 repeat protein